MPEPSLVPYLWYLLRENITFISYSQFPLQQLVYQYATPRENPYNFYLFSPQMFLAMETVPALLGAVIDFELQMKCKLQSVLTCCATPVLDLGLSSVLKFTVRNLAVYLAFSPNPRNDCIDSSFESTCGFSHLNCKHLNGARNFKWFLFQRCATFLSTDFLVMLFPLLTELLETLLIAKTNGCHTVRQHYTVL